MDASTIALAIIASLPGILAFIGQLNRDAKEERVEKEKIARENKQAEDDYKLEMQAASLSLIAPLKDRNAYLENLLKDKDAKIKELESLLSDRPTVPVKPRKSRGTNQTKGDE